MLLQAWSQLKPRDATLVVVGDGSQRHVLHAASARSAGSGQIRFVTATTDVQPYYDAADVFVLPSRSEGMSNALLEAMASGLPVIATDVGGNRAVLTRPEIGRLVALDPSALADAMGDLIEQRDAAEAMGHAARQHVIEHYSVRAMIDAYERLYSRLLKRASESVG
jgi:glycosyltransferase involved in cell wall biosynthesis